ncbi:hypothetical protein [uncultured Methanobacterium sp.]|uniref:hypothetical protein n=1 Tax=uncultured Methanobacterium sp. TaxID=176306 RepID=UPI002AA7FF4A|nr:hypothetical protein [uncultured Methanobacterium sp.]
MDFSIDLEGIILQKAKQLGISINYTDVHELLRKYINIKTKLIDNNPRKVFYSSELQSKILNEPYFNVLKKIEKKFEEGDDINPYLSRQSLKPDSQDGLLNDWGIHHLHLSDTKRSPNDQFYSRSDYLLMVIVGNDFVCFLDVRPHSESNPNNPNYPLWVRNELLEIIQKNWEKLLEPYEYKGQKPLKKYTEEEHFELRDAGLIVDAVVGDKVYAPMGGGVSTARTGLSQTLYADRILNTICDAQIKIKNNPEEIKSRMKKSGILPSEKLEFILMDDPKHGLICVETNVNWGYPLNIKL